MTITQVDGNTPCEKWTNFFTHDTNTLAREGRYSGTPFVGTLFANDAFNINLKQFLSSRDGTFKTRQDQNAPGPRVFINNAEGTGRIGLASVVIPRNAPSAAIAAAERIQFEQTGFNFETMCRPAIEKDKADIRRIIDGANGNDSRKFLAAAGKLFLQGRHNQNEWVLPQNVEIGLEYFRTGMHQKHAPSFAALGDYRCLVFERATLEGYKEKFNLTGPDEAIRPQFDAYKRETLEVAWKWQQHVIETPSNTFLPTSRIM
ncbi:hypothetical protein BDR26DRAFT_944957 [Obelidium mucronatum]|nr:hypothetical protein BDR26DRAFT_944957 [Obelidium mucronatum]